MAAAAYSHHANWLEAMATGVSFHEEANNIGHWPLSRNFIEHGTGRGFPADFLEVGCDRHK